ncbi:baculoviral IAP repeat-containing protein 7-A [Caerostris extrusa]|uniref:Baculoviral IAP repeat-containing protein 7-A n=1 Tax=Caerostris extrusa TaxID=172846 RepID=A0AAV4PCZ1_CAEEX|nr:baculoviral IAP repeat-containing protein 7-A [Caerostris extrusa]
MLSNVGNIPMQKQKTCEKKSLSKLIPNTKSNNTSLSGQAKYPMMMELNNRLATYKDWPLIMLPQTAFSECGLFYTDNEDIVTCFYCGGSLGNWELNDDPWVEHEKYFPDCRYLNLVKCHRNPEQHSTHHNLEEKKKKVVTHHLNITGGHFISFHHLCEAILDYKDREPANMWGPRIKGKSSLVIHLLNSMTTGVSMVDDNHCNRQLVLTNNVYGSSLPGFKPSCRRK